MATIDSAVPPQDLTGIVGHRFIYTYANGWQYEMYVKNATTIDYRIHSGMVGGRWVKDQHGRPRASLTRRLQDLVDRADRHERRGQRHARRPPSARHDLLPALGRADGARTVLFQNDHLDEMRAYRDAGPTYPIYVVPEFASITLFEFVGADDETVDRQRHPPTCRRASPTAPTEPGDLDGRPMKFAGRLSRPTR